MTVTLPSEVEAMIDARVEAGEYPDAAGVVTAALRLLQERDDAAKLARLRAALQVGIEQHERGQGRELTPAVYAEIVSKAERSMRNGVAPTSDALP